MQRLSRAQALGVCEAGILLCPSWGLGPRNKALVTPGVLSHISDHLQDVHWPLLDPLVGRREKCSTPCSLPPTPSRPQKPGMIRETKKKRTEPRKTVLRAQKGAREEEGGFSGGILESLVIFLYPCVHFE